MKKNELKEGHFYRFRQIGEKWYIWVFVSFVNGDWIGKYGKDDNVSYLNNLYFKDTDKSREYEEVSWNHPAFSGIGQFAIRNVFNEV